MTVRDLSRRLERLEAAPSAGEGEMIEMTLSESSQKLLCEILVSIQGEERAAEIKAEVARPQMVPRLTEAEARERGEMARGLLGRVIHDIEEALRRGGQ